MHTALLNRSLDALGAVRRHISFQAKLRSQLGIPAFGCKAEGEKCFDIDSLLEEAANSTSWRIIDHCAAVTRTYALFETFIDQLLREYLTFISSSYNLTAMGTEFRMKYTRGIGQILLDQGKQRYANLDMGAVISGAHAAVTDSTGYHIQPEALLRTEQNLRMPELQRLFSQCGLSGIDAWVKSHRAIKEFFTTQSRLSETAESELRQIVEYRNEAAHGEVDEVFGPEVLIEFTYFFEALCRSIKDFIQYDTLRRAKGIGKANVVGVISERFRDGIIVAKVTNAVLRVGDPLYVLGKGTTMVAEIKSIQLNDIDVPTATITEETEVGLSIGVRANVGSELIRID